MRMVFALLEKIRLRNTKKEYYRNAFLARLNHFEMPSLDEVLGVKSEEKSAFDSETDKQYEEHAKKMLERMRNERRESSS